MINFNKSKTKRVAAGIIAVVLVLGMVLPLLSYAL